MKNCFISKILLVLTDLIMNKSEAFQEKIPKGNSRMRIKEGESYPPMKPRVLFPSTDDDDDKLKLIRKNAMKLRTHILLDNTSCIK